MDATGDDNDTVDMNDTTDNLEDRIANLKMVFAHLKNKKMLERNENKLNKETPSSDDTTNKDITQFEVTSKSKSSTSKLKKVTTHKVVTQKVQTKPFSTKSPVPIRNCILGLAAAHTWPCIGNKIFGTRKPKDAIVADQDRNGEKEGLFDHTLDGFLQWFASVYWSGVFRMAFDPRKSLYYKVVQVGRASGESLCRDRFSYFSFDHFESAIYWNEAFHWLEGDDNGSTEFTIYQMMKGPSVWSVRYLVNIEQFMNPLPEGWSIWASV
ncbi:hypothetical protein Tco_1347714 [Tanacetum coccineum]